MSDVKDELASAFRELAELTTLDEQSPQSFRVRAYDNAVHAIRGLPADIAAMSESQLAKVKGLGKSSAKKIREYLTTGRIDKLERLREAFPREVVELSRLPGLGPKTVALLGRELGVRSVPALRDAIAAQRLRDLPGLGEKTERKLARAIERMALTEGGRRTAIADAMPIARQLVSALLDVPGVERAEHCGSLRRLRETIGDLDVLVASRDPGPVMERFVALPQVGEVLARGSTKSSIVTHRGLQVDLRVVPPEQYGAALLYFTGSKAHNIELRQRALSRGWTLNEYALSRLDGGEVVAARTEEEIYRALGLEWIPPPMREGGAEIARAADGTLPAPLSPDDLRGDLHVHTTLSGDGRSPLEEVLETAAARGYEYLAITDHAEDLPINGVDRDRLMAQRQRLRDLAGAFGGMRLLHGVELNIGPDGGLDYDEAFRAGFDWCVAAVHSHFDLPQAKQTERLLRAMAEPSVNVIGHLTGRMLGRRPGIDLDLDAVLEAAAETGTAIEINSALRRLDAAADVLHRAADRGVTFVVSSDAHHVRELDRMQWGAQQVQRGLLEPERIANTWPAERFLAWVAR